jgi:hypothetical protein
MANVAYQYDDRDAVTLEDLEARLDALQTDHEFMSERLRHIEHGLMLCFMLLLLIVVIELQLISAADLKETGKELWNWLRSIIS